MLKEPVISPCKIRLGDFLNTLKFFRDLVASLEIVRRKIYFTMVTNEQQT